MQDQLTSGQTNLQQSGSNLQPNNSDLQTSGSPTTSSDASGVLSQNYNGSLEVQSAETVQTDTPQTYLPKDTSYGWLFFPLLLLAVLVGVYIASRLRNTEEVTQVEAEPVVSTPEVASKPQAKKKKHQKKTTRKQRSRK